MSHNAQLPIQTFTDWYYFRTLFTFYLTSYWAPQIYHKSDSGELTILQDSASDPSQELNIERGRNGAKTYWYNRVGKNETLTDIPAGFRMIAGSPFSKYSYFFLLFSYDLRETDLICFPVFGFPKTFSLLMFFFRNFLQLVERGWSIGFNVLRRSGWFT